MKNQFVDLFDKDRYGINYWAGIALFVGLMGSNYALELARPGYMMFLLNLGLVARYALGLTIALVALCHVLKNDLLLPVAAGVVMVLWGGFCRAVGFYEAIGAFEVGHPGLTPNTQIPGVFPLFHWTQVLVDFASPFFVSAAVVLCFRLMRNKLEALFLGFVTAGLLSVVFWSVPYLPPLDIAVGEVLTGFVAAVCFYSGISYHFTRRGVGFSEYGIEAIAPSSVTALGGTAVQATEAEPLGKTRKPLITMLLMIITLNLYMFGWIYKVYGEIRRNAPHATTVSPGKALGFLFIPIFNFFWIVWVAFDLPHAIQRMENSDPLSGVPVQRWPITGVLLGGIAANLIGITWPWAGVLGAVLLCTGILMAQSSLNSHWRAHRAAGSLETALDTP